MELDKNNYGRNDRTYRSSTDKSNGIDYKSSMIVTKKRTL